MFVKNIFIERNAGAVIHTHSKNAVLVTMLCGNEFKISHQEMIKVTCTFKLRFSYQISSIPVPHFREYGIINFKDIIISMKKLWFQSLRTLAGNPSWRIRFIKPYWNIRKRTLFLCVGTVSTCGDGTGNKLRPCKIYFFLTQTQFI